MKKVCNINNNEQLQMAECTDCGNTPIHYVIMYSFGQIGGLLCKECGDNISKGEEQ